MLPAGWHLSVKTFLIADLFAQRTWEILGLLGVIIIVTGIWLQWQRQSHIADIEEDIKNGKTTEDRAWRRMRFVNWRAAAVLGIGIVLLLAATTALLEYTWA